ARRCAAASLRAAHARRPRPHPGAAVSPRPPQISVAGGGTCSARTARLAEAVGRELAAAGAILVCGGLGGVMEAAARGAARRGGMVVGLLPTYRHADGNAHLTVRLPTGLGHARNMLVAAAGGAVIAAPGETVNAGPPRRLVGA